jgi:hypothetical protein
MFNAFICAGGGERTRWDLLVGTFYRIPTTMQSAALDVRLVGKAFKVIVQLCHKLPGDHFILSLSYFIVRKSNTV